METKDKMSDSSNEELNKYQLDDAPTVTIKTIHSPTQNLTQVSPNSINLDISNPDMASFNTTLPSGPAGPSGPANNMFVSEARIRMTANILTDFKDQKQKLSDPVYAREMPWRILIQQRPGQNSMNYRNNNNSSGSEDSCLESDDDFGYGDEYQPNPPKDSENANSENSDPGIDLDENSGLPKLPEDVEKVIDHPLNDTGWGCIFLRKIAENFLTN